MGDGRRGDEKEASYFQIHICTPASIARLPDKRHCFLVNEYVGAKSLIERLDKFIAEKVDSAPGDPYRKLARIWRWEYGKYDGHGHLVA